MIERRRIGAVLVVLFSLGAALLGNTNHFAVAQNTNPFHLPTAPPLQLKTVTRTLVVRHDRSESSHAASDEANPESAPGAAVGPDGSGIQNGGEPIPTPVPQSSETTAPATAAPAEDTPIPEAVAVHTSATAAPKSDTKKSVGVIGEETSQGAAPSKETVVVAIVAAVAFFFGALVAGGVACFLYRRRDSTAKNLGGPSQKREVGGQQATTVFMIDGEYYEMGNIKLPGGGGSSRSLDGRGSNFSQDLDKMSDNGTIFSQPGQPGAPPSNVGGDSCNTSVGGRTPAPEAPMLMGAPLQEHGTPVHAHLLDAAPSLRSLNAASTFVPTTAALTTHQKAQAMAAMEEGLLRHHINHPLGSISPDDGVPTSILYQKKGASKNPLRIGPDGSSQVMLKHSGPTMGPTVTQAVPLKMPNAATCGMPGPSAWSVQVPPGYKPALTMSQPSKLSQYAPPSRRGVEYQQPQLQVEPMAGKTALSLKRENTAHATNGSSSFSRSETSEEGATPTSSSHISSNDYSRDETASDSCGVTTPVGPTSTQKQQQPALMLTTLPESLI